MKPIEAVTGLPKSPDVAKLVDTGARQGEIQSKLQSSAFSREISSRASSVSVSTKTAETRFDSEPDGFGGHSQDDSMSEKDMENRKHPEKQAAHPSKGRILDIHGA